MLVLFTHLSIVLEMETMLSSFPTSTFSWLVCSSLTSPSSYCHHCLHHDCLCKYKCTHSIRLQKVEQLLCHHRPSAAHTEPLLSVTTLSNSRLVTMWLFYLFVCMSVSANLPFFMNEEMCVWVCAWDGMGGKYKRRELGHAPYLSSCLSGSVMHCFEPPADVTLPPKRK